MICQQCQTELPEGARFCSGCGTPVPQPLVSPVCQQCQTELPEGARFCNECGTPVPEGPVLPVSPKADPDDSDKARPLASASSGKSAGEASLKDSIRAARVGDDVSISGLRLEYDGVRFVIEKIHRYASETETWYEARCVDGDNQVWIDWTGGNDLTVTATDNPDPVDLESIGTTEEELIRLDEENSIDNFIEIEGDKYYYRNSTEVTFYQDNLGQGEVFYNWDLVHEDGEHVLSVSKGEGKPFEAMFSEVISPDRIVLYKGDRGDAGTGMIQRMGRLLRRT